MNTPSTHSGPCSALLAGTSGLIGRALLALLLESPHYARVLALLRHSAHDLPAHPKLHIDVVDFERLTALPAVDDVFIALGTTIKVAGSEAAFRRVDFDTVLATARLARAAGARRVIVVSALGQPGRAGERWALRLLQPVLRFVPAGVRPIHAGDVASAMLRAAIDAAPGLRILSSAQMQPRDQRRG